MYASGTMLMLDGCALTYDCLDTVGAALEDCATSFSVLDVSTYLPTPVSGADAARVIQTVLTTRLPDVYRPSSSSFFTSALSTMISAHCHADATSPSSSSASGSASSPTTPQSVTSTSTSLRLQWVPFESTSTWVLSEALLVNHARNLLTAVQRKCAADMQKEREGAVPGAAPAKASTYGCVHLVSGCFSLGSPALFNPDVSVPRASFACFVFHLQRCDWCSWQKRQA
jgi:hypothetical protein